MRLRPAEHQCTATSFIGSFLDGPDQVVIELRGDLGAEVLDRLAVHVNDALVSGSRFLLIDASGVTSCDAGLLDLLGWAQRRLGRRFQGLVTVRGLRPHLLPGAEPAVDPEHREATSAWLPAPTATLSGARQATS